MMGPSLTPPAPIPVSGRPVRERVVHYEQLTSSGTWSKAEVLARPAFAGLNEDDVIMRIRCVGGGGGGRVGGTEYGGMPGAVATRRMYMAQLNDTENVAVGAGGLSASNGSFTFFGGELFDDAKVRAYGGISYPAADIALAVTSHSNLSEAHVPDLRVTGSMPRARPSSGNGPGGGGPTGSGRLLDGGFGSAMYGFLATTPGQSAGAAGGNAIPGHFDSFGAGGAGNASGTGGAGGFPGAGGGAGSSSGGPGGNGCIRIEYIVLEVA